MCEERCPSLAVLRFVADDRQAVERERCRRTWSQPGSCPPAERQRAVAIGLTRQRAQRDADFGRLQAAQQAHGAEMMAMQPFGEPPQHGLLRVGRHALDDQLMPRDAERDQGAVAHQALGMPRDGLGRRSERGVPLRVHRVPVQRDGQLDEEIREVARR